MSLAETLRLPKRNRSLHSATRGNNLVGTSGIIRCSPFPVACEPDLLPDFRTIDKLRDWLPIRREQCAKRVLRKSRWSRHPRGGIANGFPAVAKRHGIS